MEAPTSLMEQQNTMNDINTLANFAEIIGAAIVIGGVYFAIMQMRHLRQQRREMAAIELFRFFGNPSFVKAYLRVLHLPEGLSAEDIRNGEDDLEGAATLISNTMENIGVMTFQRIVPFTVVNNLMGSSAVVLWNKMQHWTFSLREELDDPAAFEWFQWLAERLRDYAEKHDTGPAYESEAGWLPNHVRNNAD